MRARPLSETERAPWSHQWRCWRRVLRQDDTDRLQEACASGKVEGMGREMMYLLDIRSGRSSRQTACGWHVTGSGGLQRPTSRATKASGTGMLNISGLMNRCGRAGQRDPRYRKAVRDSYEVSAFSCAACNAIGEAKQRRSLTLHGGAVPDVIARRGTILRFPSTTQLNRIALCSRRLPQSEPIDHSIGAANPFLLTSRCEPTDLQGSDDHRWTLRS